MKDAFEKLFGMKKSEVMRNCILVPFAKKPVLKKFRLKGFSKGKLYAAGNSRSFTLVHTGIGPTFVGDAVLYLAQTPCQNLILFGACGLLGNFSGLEIGTLVSPSRCYSLESFTNLLLKKSEFGNAFYPDRQLQEDLLQADNGSPLKEVTCLSIGSLKLQTEKGAYFQSKGIQVVDMECAAFLAASQYIGRKAAALFIITDIIGEKPFYRDIPPKEQLSLFTVFSRAVEIICKLTEKKLNV